MVCEDSAGWRIDTVAVKRSDPRKVLQLRTQTPYDFIGCLCRRCGLTSIDLGIVAGSDSRSALLRLRRVTSRGPGRWPGQSGKERQSHNLLFLLNVTGSSLEAGSIENSGDLHLSLLFLMSIRYRAVSPFKGTAPEATMSVVPNSGNGKITVPDLLRRKIQAAGPHSNSQKITCLTAYDYPTARLLDEAGVDVILVGDSLGMVVLGHESTLPVTIDEMLHHTRAARRGMRRALLVADMPYGSYHTDLGESLHNAMRFVKEAGAEDVKVEGGERRLA